MRAGCYNTALADLKRLGLITDEAIRLEFCDRICCRKTGLQKRPAKQKPEIPDADIARHLATRRRRDIFGQQALGLLQVSEAKLGNRERRGLEALANQLAADANPRKIVP